MNLRIRCYLLFNDVRLDEFSPFDVFFVPSVSVICDSIYDRYFLNCIYRSRGPPIASAIKLCMSIQELFLNHSALNAYSSYLNPKSLFKTRSEFVNTFNRLLPSAAPPQRPESAEKNYVAERDQ